MGSGRNQNGTTQDIVVGLIGGVIAIAGFATSFVDIPVGYKLLICIFLLVIVIGIIYYLWTREFVRRLLPVLAAIQLIAVTFILSSLLLDLNAIERVQNPTTIALENTVTAAARVFVSQTSAPTITPNPSATLYPTITPNPTLTPDVTITAAFALLTQYAQSEATSTSVALTSIAEEATRSAVSCPDPSTPFTGGNENWPWEDCVKEFNGVLMVLVPKSPVWDVEPFWIDQFEVTIGEYKSCVDGAGTRGSLCNGSRLGTTITELPAYGMRWVDARSYCVDWRGDNLPSLEQWDYAARGPDNWQFPWGNNFIYGYAILGKSRPMVRNSSRLDRSWVGAFDMAGNVHEFLAQEPGSTSIMLRGGGFSFFESPIINLSGTPAPQYTSRPDDGWTDAGIRCLREFAPADLNN